LPAVLEVGLMVEQLEPVEWDIVPPGNGPRMSFEEFQRWYDAGHRGEWVNGEVIPLMPPDERHQDIVLLLGFVLSKFARLRGLGKVIITPFEMRLHGGRSYREPDIAFVTEANRNLRDGRRIDGPADLVVEVVSPSSVAQDRRNKMSDYAAAGVIEYWIVDPRPNRTPFEAFSLHEDGYYQPIVARPDGLIASTVLAGFLVDPAWFGQSDLPDDDAMLAAQGV
jgi:Uma2 family endonuclease